MKIFASFIIEHIFPRMIADFRFRSPPRSFKARAKIGMRIANEGASIECMNSHSKSASRAAFVLFAGSVSAAIRTPLKEETSGLRITEEISTRAIFALSLTFGCPSRLASIIPGIIWGRLVASCLGAQNAIVPRSFRASCFDFQAVSAGKEDKIGVSTCLTPCALSLAIMVFAAA